MLCPNCHYEYIGGILACPDCNVALVEQLPVRQGGAAVPDDSWIAVGRVAGTAGAELARGALDSNNIPSVVLSATFGLHERSLPPGSRFGRFPRGSSFIMVPREYRDEAALILEGVLGEDLTQPEGI
ncbi:MAG TPA: hypothetical protein VN285_05560 [Candidatus Deferrimicrobium sp.]|nr:hypothetical protein [Candidatus Deferrimicrobium sp.]